MRFLVITMVLCLLCLTVPVAHAEYDEEECPGNSCEAPPGNSGGGSVGDVTAEGGDATATAFGGTGFGFGGSASSGSSIYAPDFSFDYNPSSAYSNSGANALSFQEQYNSMYQGQGQGFEAFNGNTTIVNPGLGEGIQKGMERSAPPAPRVESDSRIVETNPCGDSTGLSLSTGPVAGGAGTITEACRVFRLNLTVDHNSNTLFCIPTSYGTF